MKEKMQKILERILERNGATNCRVECNGEIMELNYSFQVSSGNDISGSFKFPCENTVQENLRYVSCAFWTDCFGFDEDNFVRDRMDADGAPTIRALLDDSVEVHYFYESMYAMLKTFCDSSEGYRDTESGEIFTKLELLEQYIENEDDIYESSGAKNFWEYLNCCLDGNGFLEEI